VRWENSILFSKNTKDMATKKAKKEDKSISENIESATLAKKC
jgi:hypothetical protein